MDINVIIIDGKPRIACESQILNEISQTVFVEEKAEYLGVSTSLRVFEKSAIRQACIITLTKLGTGWQKEYLSTKLFATDLHALICPAMNRAFHEKRTAKCEIWLLSFKSLRITINDGFKTTNYKASIQ